jgi:hypothetical protein
MDLSPWRSENQTSAIGELLTINPSLIPYNNPTTIPTSCSMALRNSQSGISEIGTDVNIVSVRIQTSDF